MSLYDVPCAVTADLNRYLATLGEDDSRDEAIEQRTDELLAGAEYDPFSPDNLSEALRELDMTAITACCQLFKAGNKGGVGLALDALIRDYWRGFARNEAERQIDNEAANACPRCKGLGCRHCDEDFHRDD
jgi:hypothetical protein